MTNNSLFSKKLYWLLALLLFALGLGIRLVDFNDLPLDFHPTRQLFSALKARGIYYQDAPNIPDWQREMAVRQWKAQATIEPEIVEHLAVYAYRLAGEVNLMFPRLFSITFWMLGGVFLFLAARRLASADGALLSLTFYLFLPYGIFASRSFQPDPLMVALIAGFIWAVDIWDEEKTWQWAILAGLFGGLAILVKTVAAFFIAGGALGILLGGIGFRKSLQKAQVWGIALLSILPTAAYFFYGVVVNGFLSRQFGGRFFPELLISPYFYLRWALKLNEVMGYLAVALSLLGLLLFMREKRAFLLGLWGGYVAYGLIFNYHFSTHDYYQLPFILVAALSLAALGEILSRALREQLLPRAAQLSATALMLFVVLATSWSVRTALRAVDYRPFAESYLEIGDLLRDQGSVVALSKDYGYRLDYWGWLRTTHWPSLGDLGYQEKRGNAQSFAQVFETRTNGRSFFLITDMEEWILQTDLQEYLAANYPLFAEGDGYLIFDLGEKK
ncbi:MAG: glycosyltransferase family 39 protein [Anaerolineales bacterium]|nr:glycosyltransferase family 39 protein [Anaerolineales bacterium]